MKKFPLTLLAILFLACSDSDDAVLTEMPALRGTWLLVEQYSDPGDGSGDFMKVDSKKTIEFLMDGRFRSNGSLCDLDADTGLTTSGKFIVNDSLTEFSTENYLLPEGCNFEDYQVYFHLDRGSLILSYACIEGCAQKFRRR